MSKRHQASRRRAYARRQHELHERRAHGAAWDELRIQVTDIDDGVALAAFDELASRRTRLSFLDVLAPRSRLMQEAR